MSGTFINDGVTERDIMETNPAPRKCGSCTMCCKVMGVPELDKPPAAWCQHCAIGKGCTVYNVRPNTCREFECLWLIDERWPESLRPDKSRVVMSSTLDGTRLVANVDPGRPEAHLTGEMGRVLAAASRGVDVIVVIGDRGKILTAPEREKSVRAFIKDHQR